MENLKVKQIDYKTAMNVIVEKHYLHRKCPCSIAFGLFDVENLVGVIVFGKPSSYTLCEGIAGKEESKNVVEFNRLWVCETMPKNTDYSSLKHRYIYFNADKRRKKELLKKLKYETLPYPKSSVPF
mgnify:CR=1 FL=1